MTKAGEESGDPTEMFKTIAEYYEQELDETVSQVTESIEPIITVVMGVIVGFILVAMYMPMFQIGKAI
jgi:type IV pilus assembly protein PilC